MNSLIPEYVNALCQETESVLTMIPDHTKAHTIFFGGGTPSLLSIDQYKQIFETINRNIEVHQEVEITLEANPETVSYEYINGLRRTGFNRISFGMQSVSAEDLRVLDREHKFESVVNAVKWSKQAGFKHINLDLIFGIPGQSRDGWNNTLKQAFLFNIDHLSIYSLIIEEGTRMKTWIEKGILEAPDDDLSAIMYEDAMELLEKAGYQQYEISNWSFGLSAQCRHNLQYWRFLPYLGFGAGAHGFYGNIRTQNPKLIREYIDCVNNYSVKFPLGTSRSQKVTLSIWDKIEENLMVSLRLTNEGINIPEFDIKYGISLRDIFRKQVRRLLKNGLIEITDEGKRLRLTRKGRLLGNRVFLEFIGNEIPKGYEYLAVQ